MPLTRIAMQKGKNDGYRKAVFDGVYQAMRETFNVPEDDRFMTITQHAAGEFDYGKGYLDIDRSDDLIVIQITCNNTRTVEMKKALYKRIAELLSADPGVRAEDIFINIVESPKENWSFGNGIAQFA